MENLFIRQGTFTKFVIDFAGLQHICVQTEQSKGRSCMENLFICQGYCICVATEAYVFPCFTISISP